MHGFQRQERDKRLGWGLSLLFMAVVLFFPRPGASETVSLPVTIDFPLLSSLTANAAFPGKGQSAVVYRTEQGCQEVILSEPRFSEKGGMIVFEVKAHVQWGFTVFGRCLTPITWDGYISLLQKPRIDDRWSLSFETVDSTIYDKRHGPARIAQTVWSHVKPLVYDYVNGITIDLAPPVDELGLFFEALFPPEHRNRAEGLVKSMRPGMVETTASSVKIAIMAEVEPNREIPAGGEEERITEEGWAIFIENWESLDVFLVQVITSLSGEPLTDDERQILLSVLLDTRYRFSFELDEKIPDNDFIRGQFVEAWRQMSSIFRNHLVRDSSRSILSYLAFFTASDALVALDKIGPSLGIEISRNGLIRLANLISEGRAVDMEYRYGVNAELRKVLGLGIPLQALGPAIEGDWLDLESGQPEDDGTGVPVGKESSLRPFIRPQISAASLAGAPQKANECAQIIRNLSEFFFTPAHADEKSPPSTMSEIVESWVMPKNDPAKYLERVKSLLTEASSGAFKKAELPAGLESFYKTVVLATAWTESCYHQFKIKAKRIYYIRSYNGTSVGIMQINERAWRGIYDEKHLRWDVAYNVLAGCEILALYLGKYAIKEMDDVDLDSPPHQATLARLLYAVYNGGPNQVRKFAYRTKKGRFHLSDKVFFEKYEWVLEEKWEKIRECILPKSQRK